MIRFTSPAGASVSMFDKDAKALIRMMGLSGTVPSAIRAEDIPAALQQLEAALQTEEAKAAESQQLQPPHGGSEEKAVSVNVRAYPLIQLLKAAIAGQKNVMWEQDKGFF
ncbi:MAG TPA: DUF1840 domain-containing protein [Candidatus Thiothrix moscowensis]|uniref:DUF1840 domain-containing protein n=1 Tax=unclassified Thiothrix TaxID=2636184 RepID=UPI0025F5DAB9|nr:MULTISPECIES: DUF1840 domain-containing protein [unclassified Thiothrix]HRJ51763.1 DUF1840 domain-containing protein [Candidatus Thiothrix moscowensis]HRJ92078.1 DUF1840 domain-containing protein [Candidatus Thiothrix moscowensis]